MDFMAAGFISLSFSVASEMMSSPPVPRHELSDVTLTLHQSENVCVCVCALVFALQGGLRCEASLGSRRA